MRTTLLSLALAVSLTSSALWGTTTLSRYAITPQSAHQMETIGERFEVVRKTPTGYEILVPVEARREILRLAPDARLIERDISAKWRTRGALAGYHNFDSVQAELKALSASHPDMTALENYGTSKEGRPLLALRVHAPFQTLVEKPKIFISSATHGNELITVEVVFGILNSLIDGYGTDERLTRIVDEHEIFFVPVVNPDGYVRQDRLANGIDPNRDYPWPGNPEKKSNPIIQALKDYFAKHQFVASIDYHSEAAMIMYPWAYTYDHIGGEEEAKFEKITGEMAQANGYEHGQISEIIYVAKGSSADYYYWKHQTFALGIEISRNGPSSQIPSLVKENLESTYRFLEAF